MAKTPEEKAKWAAYMREWTRRNRDRLNRERRERHANDPEFHARMKQSNLKSMEKRGPEAVKAEQTVKYRKHGHKYRARLRDQYAADPTAKLASCKKWRAANPEKVAAAKLAWARQDRAKHPEKYKAKLAAIEAWRKQDRLGNPAKYSAKNAARRAKRLKRTPAWANLKKIELVYQLCNWASRFTDEPLHVDHVAPLCGKNISGLHVAENLQILPASENFAKNNTWNSP